MPLSEPAAREPLHTRAIEMRGYIRDDGLWDIEGHLTDRKSYGYDGGFRGWVEPETPVHDMWLRLTVDDDLVIRACEAATDHHPRGGPPRVERLAQLGTVAYQTHVAKRRVKGKPMHDPDDPKRKPLVIDTCHAMASDGPVVKARFPEYYTGE